MSAALKFAPHYTVDDYSLWKGDWELWEGLAIAMSPSPLGVHQDVVTQLIRMLGNAVEAAGCDANPLVELDWIVSRDTVVRPDVLVVCGPPPEQHCENTPALVAEVLSDSTRQNDLDYKRQLYHREGVGVYLIIDVEAKTAQVDSRVADGSYDTHVAGDELGLRLCEDCEISIPITKLFRH
tara:strand:- start:17696 stop:18238 length:543 start_codon:yes stop_codon:yes gene_type:complete